MFPDHLDYGQVSETFGKLAREASDAILRHYKEPGEIRLKPDDSPVTAADEEANEIIVTGLNRVYPGIPVLAEESVDDPARMTSRLLFVVDPLDGTKEYIKRNGEFSVNIALLLNNQPIVGHIRMPVTGHAYSAIRGEGAWFTADDDGKPERIHVSSKTEDLCLTLSRSSPSVEQEKLMRHKRVANTRETGSSLKGCLIAQGLAEVYYRYGRTMEWDTAAMQCIVEEAGGIMRQMDDSPMVYNKPIPENADGFYIVNRLENRLHAEA